MRRTLARWALAAIVAVAAQAQATMVVGTSLTITNYNVYDHNIGVVLRWSGGAITGCGDGAWIPTTSAAFKNLYATLMLAKATGNTVTLYLDNDPTTMWPGGGTYCKVIAIIVE